MRTGFVLGLMAICAGCGGSEDGRARDGGTDLDSAVQTDGNMGSDGFHPSGDLGINGVVQMNDVSVLYPLAKSANELNDGYLLASSPGVGGVLLPKALYAGAIGPQADAPLIGEDPGLAYDDLRLVGFRVDPCFAQIGPITDPSKCENQLRLIFQDLSWANGATSAADGAVHAFYAISRAELVALVDGLIALRENSAGEASLGALAVHPLLVQEGLGGAQAKGLNALVTKYAGQQKLVRFTAFVSGNTEFFWTFEGFDVSHDVATPMVVPTLPGNATSVKFSDSVGVPLAGTFLPATMATDDMQLLGNAATAKIASLAAQQAAVDAALRIENPNFHSPNTMDCASCHMSNPALRFTAEQLGLTIDGNANAFVPDSKWISASEMQQTTPMDAANGLNVHVFSYRRTTPLIAQRVINETANVVAYLNSL